MTLPTHIFVRRASASDADHLFELRDDRRGVGRSLVAHAEHWANSRHARLVALATRRAEPFWRAVGYEPSAT